MSGERMAGTTGLGEDMELSQSCPCRQQQILLLETCLKSTLNSSSFPIGFFFFFFFFTQS